MMVNSRLERYFSENVAVQAMYRAQDRSWLPGPAESVSLAIVDGIVPAEFKAYVKSLLTYEDGWKQNPTSVMRNIFDAAESWRLIEAHVRRNGGTSADGSRQKQQQKQQSPARASSPRAYYNCGDAGHLPKDCPKPRA